MTSTNDPGKKRVNTRGRKPPEVVRPQTAAPAATTGTTKDAGPAQRAHPRTNPHAPLAPTFVGGARNEQPRKKKVRRDRSKSGPRPKYPRAKD